MDVPYGKLVNVREPYTGFPKAFTIIICPIVPEANLLSAILPANIALVIAKKPCRIRRT